MTISLRIYWYKGLWPLMEARVVVPASLRWLKERSLTGRRLRIHVSFRSGSLYEV
jgi:hypothetical protein